MYAALSNILDRWNWAKNLPGLVSIFLFSFFSGLVTRRYTVKRNTIPSSLHLSLSLPLPDVIVSMDAFVLIYELCIMCAHTHTQSPINHQQTHALRFAAFLGVCLCRCTRTHQEVTKPRFFCIFGLSRGLSRNETSLI